METIKLSRQKVLKLESFFAEGRAINRIAIVLISWLLHHEPGHSLKIESRESPCEVQWGSEKFLSDPHFGDRRQIPVTWMRRGRLSELLKVGGFLIRQL